MLDQRLIGIATYAEGVPFNGTLRIKRKDGNALQEMWRELPIVSGVIPDYVRLYPGIYEIQWLPNTPDGLLPSEEWLIPEINEINIREIRDRYSVPSLLEQKDKAIAALQEEMARLKQELVEAPTKVEETEEPTNTTEELIKARIASITGEAQSVSDGESKPVKSRKTKVLE